MTTREEFFESLDDLITGTNVSGKYDNFRAHIEEQSSLSLEERIQIVKRVFTIGTPKTLNTIIEYVHDVDDLKHEDWFRLVLETLTCVRSFLDSLPDEEESYAKKDALNLVTLMVEKCLSLGGNKELYAKAREIFTFHDDTYNDLQRLREIPPPPFEKPLIIKIPLDDKREIDSIIEDHLHSNPCQILDFLSSIALLKLPESAERRGLRAHFFMAVGKAFPTSREIARELKAGFYHPLKKVFFDCTSTQDPLRYWQASQMGVLMREYIEALRVQNNDDRLKELEGKIEGILKVLTDPNSLSLGH